MREILIPVQHIPQWSKTSCFDCCKKMVSDYFVSLGKQENNLIEGGPKNAIWLAIGEDSAGHVIPDLEKLKQARNFIDTYLENNLPVIVGVSHMNSNYNFDKVTDHFVLIIGRNENCTKYTFLDPGTSSSKKQSEFSIYETGQLYRPGNEAFGYVCDRWYDLSCVRSWIGVNVL